MKTKDKFNFKWERIIDEVYLQNDQFDYKKMKRIIKDINNFYNELKHIQRETETTLAITEFNNNQKLKEEFEQLITYSKYMQKYIEQFNELDPKTKKGYYNYLKNMIGYL